MNEQTARQLAAMEINLTKQIAGMESRLSAQLVAMDRKLSEQIAALEGKVFQMELRFIRWTVSTVVTVAVIVLAIVRTFP